MNLLMHMCCGPCSCWPTRSLRAKGIDPVGYFFNPNIHPYEEWRRRLNAAKDFAEKVSMKIVVDNHYGLREFLAKTLPLIDPDDTIQNVDGHHARCRMCYAWRLSQTARFAAENHFDAFTSTLFYSKYQNHELMKSIAQKIADQIGVEFYYEDWRDGWQNGIDISVELGLYRQNYCGCVFSEEERFSSELRKARRKYFRSIQSSYQSACKSDIISETRGGDGR